MKCLGFDPKKCEEEIKTPTEGEIKTPTEGEIKTLTKRFLEKVAMNLNDITSATTLIWSNKNVTDEDVHVIHKLAIDGVLNTCKKLFLSSNKIGVKGMQTFATAVTNGRLSNIQSLFLSSNNIGDEGMEAFATAVASGLLLQLQHLELGINKIGNSGMKAFATAVASVSGLRWEAVLQKPSGRIQNNHALADAIQEQGSASVTFDQDVWKRFRINKLQLSDYVVAGAYYFQPSRSLPQLQNLFLHSNEIGDDGMQEFAAAVASGSLPHLRTLNLEYNKIGDDGMKALATAVANGSVLDPIKFILRGNNATDEGETAMLNVAETRNFNVSLE